jgi:hypothetical protein
MAFARLRRLPSSVFGPLDFRPLLRLTSARWALVRDMGMLGLEAGDAGRAVRPVYDDTIGPSRPIVLRFRRGTSVA